MKLLRWIKLRWYRYRVSRADRQHHEAYRAKIRWESRERAAKERFDRAIEDRNWYADKHDLPATKYQERQQRLQS